MDEAIEILWSFSQEALEAIIKDLEAGNKVHSVRTADGKSVTAALVVDPSQTHPAILYVNDEIPARFLGDHPVQPTVRPDAQADDASGELFTTDPDEERGE